MSRDPFEEMQRRNPITRDELPMAPMSVAESILGRRGRAAMPGWAMGVAAAFLVAAVGGGMLFWLNGGEPAPVGGGGATTTSIEPATTATVTPAIEASDVDAVAYFFVDQVGEGWTGGPFLVPVARLGVGSDEARAAMAVLLDNPSSGEESSVPALSSAIPEGTILNGVTVSGGIATVDLSAEFVSGGGSASMIGRVGQVVYTLTRLDGVDGVRFEIAGEPTTVFGGEGLVVDDPATREGFDDLLPAIMTETPTYGGAAGNPLIATGTANVFEGTVSLTLTDGDGLIIFDGFTTATCGTGCRGEWEVSVDYDASGISQAGEWGSLIVFESSAEDGRPTNVREHPVWLHGDAESPGSTTTSIVPVECSGRLANQELVDQPGLPAAVAEKRAAIWDAAVECDWDQLQRLLGPGLVYSFGGQDLSIDAPIHHWQYLEDVGEQPMLFLAELLNRPFRMAGVGDENGYVWPSAFGVAWSATTATVPEVASDVDKEALRPLYGDADFVEFEAFGAYIGYRIGITDDGTWVFFVAGD